MSTINIGEEVRRLREAKGWTQHELARRADLHDAQISRIENGHEIPFDGQLARLAKALRVGVAALKGNAP